MTHMVECLPSRDEALSSNPNPSMINTHTHIDTHKTSKQQKKPKVAKKANKIYFFT
jgi:hypothetical protein